MADAPHFAKLIPGFDFLQGLVQNAGAALPNIGQWVAPILDPEELEKRIGELRTVQFWLEQNAKLLGATIQALEVQRMTLSTLKTMNVQMEDLRDSLRIRLPDATQPAASAAEEPKADAPLSDASTSDASTSDASKAAPKPATAPGPVDPLQWWNALTQQFTQLATNAIKQAPSEAAQSLAGGAIQQSFDAASEMLKKALPPAAAPARKTTGKTPSAPHKRVPAAKR